MGFVCGFGGFVCVWGWGVVFFAVVWCCVVVDTGSVGCVIIFTTVWH